VSQENVDTLERWRESWSRQDGDATVACLHDAVEIDFLAARGPFRGVYRGPSEVFGFLRSIWEAWDRATTDFADVIECGPDRVITVNVFSGEGRTSGVPAWATVAILWNFRNGLIHRAELFQTKDEALEAIGRV
jgi:ketosteroid isomerase-like protein